MINLADRALDVLLWIVLIGCISGYHLYTEKMQVDLEKSKIELRVLELQLQIEHSKMVKNIDKKVEK